MQNSCGDNLNPETRLLKLVEIEDAKNGIQRNRDADGIRRYRQDVHFIYENATEAELDI